MSKSIEEVKEYIEKKLNNAVFEFEQAELKVLEGHFEEIAQRYKQLLEFIDSEPTP